jgi:hypothetical protein
VREAAILALGAIGGPEAIELLGRSLESGPLDDRATGARALGLAGGPRAVELLIEALSDAPADVWEAAAEALGKIGDPRAVDPLRSALQVPGCARTAVKALGAIGDPSAVPDLCALLDAALDHPHAVSLGDVLDALVGIGDTAALGALRTAFAKHPCEGLARARALLGDAEAVDWLCDWLGRCDRQQPYWTAAAHRRRVAKGLKELYHSGRLGEAARQAILAQRARMETPHTDYAEPRSNDCGPHVDQGIGVSLE